MKVATNSRIIGKNTGERQQFIIDNLRAEQDLVEEIEKDIKESKGNGDGKYEKEAEGEVVGKEE